MRKTRLLEMFVWNLYDSNNVLIQYDWSSKFKKSIVIQLNESEFSEMTKVDANFQLLSKFPSVRFFLFA